MSEFVDPQRTSALGEGSRNPANLSAGSWPDDCLLDLVDTAAGTLTGEGRANAGRRVCAASGGQFP
jgi:hypothetical protein